MCDFLNTDQLAPHTDIGAWAGRYNPYLWGKVFCNCSSINGMQVLDFHAFPLSAVKVFSFTLKLEDFRKKTCSFLLFCSLLSGRYYKYWCVKETTDTYILEISTVPFCWPLIGNPRILFWDWFQASSSLHECQKDAGTITKVAFVVKFLLESIENFSAMLAFLSFHTLGFTIAATLVCFNSCSFWLCQYSLCAIFL